MSRRKWGILGALAALSIGGLVWLGTRSDAERYRWFQRADALDAVLSTQVVNGMAVGEVEELLGPPIRGENQDRLRRAVQDFMRQTPDGFPDGIEARDEWITYPLRDGSSVSLQTRDGRLVNFDPAAFAEPIGMVH